MTDIQHELRKQLEVPPEWRLPQEPDAGGGYWTNNTLSWAASWDRNLWTGWLAEDHPDPEQGGKVVEGGSRREVLRLWQLSDSKEWVLLNFNRGDWLPRRREAESSQSLDRKGKEEQT